MTLIELARLAADVRRAQKAYFRSRSATDLERAKKLEGRLDAVLPDLLRQPTFFDREESPMTTPKQPGFDVDPTPFAELRKADGTVTPLSSFTCPTCMRLVGLARPPGEPEVAYDAIETTDEGTIRFVPHDCDRDTGDGP